MTQYQSVNVKLLDWQLNKKLKLATKNTTDLTLRLSSIM